VEALRQLRNNRPQEAEAVECLLQLRRGGVCGHCWQSRKSAHAAFEALERAVEAMQAPSETLGRVALPLRWRSHRRHLRSLNWA
jgi:hypothetical protein